MYMDDKEKYVCVCWKTSSWSDQMQKRFEAADEGGQWAEQVDGRLAKRQLCWSERQAGQVSDQITIRASHVCRVD